MDKTGRNCGQEEDWQVICQHSLFSSRLLQLEEICDLHYHGSSHEFTINYLKPVVQLLDDIRTRCEEYYGQKPKNKGGYLWTEQFENIIKYAIHPTALRLPLHKGDFYIHISSTIPRTLELKYFHLGDIKSSTLSMTDCILMCSENWTELLRSNIRDRFVYSNCIIWAYRFDRVSWKNLLKAIFAGRINQMEETTETPPLQLPTANALRETINSTDLNEATSLILNLNFELLHSQVAYIPGSRDTRGGPVVYIDASTSCWDSISVTSEELAKLLVYYYKIPRESVQHKGCSLVIDARESLLSLEVLECIGEAVMTLQVQVPGSVHMAYVLTKKDSLMLLFKSSKIKENLNFEFQFISSIEKLSRDIPIAQLPVNFGGQLHYNHEEWIKFRTKIEPFMAGCRSAAKHAMNYIQELSRTDIGYSVEDCNSLLQLHRAKIKEVLQDSRLLGLQTEGKQLIERLIEEECEETSNEDYIATLECVKRLYIQMNRVFDRLKELSDKRTTSLELCKSIKEFEEDSHKIVNWIRSEGIPYLEKHVENGDSLLHAQSIAEDFEKYSAVSEEHMEHSEEVILKGKYLAEVDEIHVEQDRIKETLRELNSVLHEYSQKYNERKKKINQSQQFYTLVEKVTERWTVGFKYAAHMNMEDIQTIEGIQRLKNSLNEFMMQNPAVSESELAKITELAHHLGSNQVKQAEQVNCRCLEAQVMLQNKQNQINGAEMSFMKTSSAKSEGDESSQGFRDGDLSTDADDDEFRDHEIPYSESPPSSIAGGHHPAPQIYCWKEDSKHYDENDSNIAVFDAAMSPKTKERLDYIINEIIETEKEYVLSLEYVLENYMPCMDGDAVAPVLKGKKNVLFGNIKRIYEFHKRFFSQELESFRHNPLQIGRCFLKWERQFNLYALYNKNKPRSDMLWNDYANIFFQAKMRELHDKLDLASYLIKPVQRLGKYALLLKDVISCCDAKDPRGREITDAHELMKFQLRHGNDLLAMDSIRYADMNLKEQGCLLRQADFYVHYGKRKRMRRVFLFEQAVIFTKAKKQKAKGDTFVYKNSIKTVDVGLTETIGESGLKFEIWYRRWKKGRSNDAFILQASSPFVKNSWTEDITRILWRQATRNKEYGLTEASTGISVESTPSSIFIDPGSTSYNSNNQTTFTRTRNIPDVSSPRAHHPSYNKRHSWLSTEESSGSSGVYDLESLPEEGRMMFSPRPDTEISKSEYKYSTMPRKKQIVRSSSANIPTTETSDSTNPVTLRRDLPGGFNPNFVRKNVYRNTMHCESSSRRSTDERAGHKSGRFATQPIILPNKTIIPKGSNTLPRSRSDYHTSSAINGISNVAFTDNNNTKMNNGAAADITAPKEEKPELINRSNTIPKSRTESQICELTTNTNDINSSIKDGHISHTATEQRNNKRNSDLFSSGRLWDSLGRRLSFNKTSQRSSNDGSRSEGCISPTVVKQHSRRRSDVPTTLAEDTNLKLSIKLRKNTSDSNIPSSVIEQLVN